MFGSGIGLIKYNSRAKRDGIRDPEGIKVVCSKYCFSASHFGTPEKIPDKDTIGYMDIGGTKERVVYKVLAPADLAICWCFLYNLLSIMVFS